MSTSSTIRAVRVHRPGGPEAMGIDDLPLPAPGPGQARVRLEFAGVNFIDVYHRSGAYPLPTPFVPGSEGAGVVDAVGAGVAEPRVGDRVAWAMQPGSYAECAVFDARTLVPDRKSTRLNSSH